MDEPNKYQWHQCVMWHMAGMLPRLRLMTFEERKPLLESLVEISSEHALHIMPKAQFEVPLWSSEKLTGGQVAALMVAGLWVQIGEDEQMASGLIGDWPEIKDAMNIAGMFS